MTLWHKHRSNIIAGGILSTIQGLSHGRFGTQNPELINLEMFPASMQTLRSQLSYSELLTSGSMPDDVLLECPHVCLEDPPILY